MTINVDDLKADLAKGPNSTASLIRHVVAELQANRANPEAIDNLAKTLEDASASLSQAVNEGSEDKPEHKAKPAKKAADQGVNPAQAE